MRKLALVLVAACSSPHHNQVIIGDAPPDVVHVDAPIVGANAVAIDTFGGTTALFAYRDGTGPWQTATADARGTYTIYVSNDYQVVVACTGTGTSDVATLSATFGDGNQQFIFCNPPVTSAAGQTVAITGHMVQPGTVSFGDTATSATGPWDFSLNVETGTHDLIAMSTSNQMVIRRAQPVTAAGSVTAIDAAQEGSPMVDSELTVSGLGSGEAIDTEFYLFLGYDFTSWSSTTTSIETPPQALMMQNDFQELFVQGYTGNRSHYADTIFSGTETTFTLLPLLDGVTFTVANGALVANWGTLPAYNELAASMYTATATETTVATKAWLDLHPTTHLTFDAMPPGFDPTWIPDLHQPYFGDFTVRGTDVHGASVGTSVVTQSSVRARQPARVSSSMIAGALGRGRSRWLSRAHRTVESGVPPYTFFAPSGAPASIK